MKRILETTMGSLDQVKATRKRQDKAKTVLVVEDEPVIIMIADALLKQMGHKVKLAMSIKEAQNAVLQSQGGFDIIFTDLCLGIDQPSGLDFAKWLRAEEVRMGWAAVPLIAVTGKPTISNLSDLSGVVVKPYNTERIQECLDKWCHQ
jgi:CheY-like chemotaxis protein